MKNNNITTNEITELRNVNPFLYSKESSYKTKTIGLFGFLATLLAAFGFIRFMELSPWYWLTMGPIALLWFFNHSVRNFIRLWYKHFSKKDHLKFVNEFWEKNSEPPVAIFLPWCGESLVVYEKTLMGVYNIQYKNKKVYLLDDKGDKNLESLANKYGFTYLSRPNKGEYRKSGNLQYGWDHSTEEYAFVLDADFIPIPEALQYLIPYITSNPKIGILQTPQYFEQTKEKHKENSLEFGGANIVEEFYNIDQVCRDRFDAAICVGTSAIYRRAAIESVGGTPKVWGTEDVRTGLLITRGGYKVKYIPLIVSIGTSPSTLQDYFRQHHRWCWGSIQILSDYYFKAKLSLAGRIIYLLNPFYYISEALSPILVFHFVAILAFQPNTIALYNSLLFMPRVLLELILMPMVFRIHKMKFGSRLAAMNNIYTYFYTVFIDMPSKSKFIWHPAGVAIGGVSSAFRGVMRLGIGLSILYVTSLTAVLIYRREFLLNIQISVVLFWALYIAIWNMLYIYSATKFLKTHDTTYIHPTSKIRTKIRHIWAHIKHVILPILTGFLFLSIGINIYQLWSVYKPSQPSIQVANLKIIEPLESPEPYVYISYYTVPVDPGDGRANIARKAIQMYLNDSSLVLSTGQSMAAEVILQNQLENLKPYTVGQTVKVGKPTIEADIKMAMNI